MLYYWNQLKEDKIRLNNDDDCAKLAKDLEMLNVKKHKNLLKFYKRVIKKEEKKKSKMQRKRVEKMFDLEAKC